MGGGLILSVGLGWVLFGVVLFLSIVLNRGWFSSGVVWVGFISVGECWFIGGCWRGFRMLVFVGWVRLWAKFGVGLLSTFPSGSGFPPNFLIIIALLSFSVVILGLFRSVSCMSWFGFMSTAVFVFIASFLI